MSDADLPDGQQPDGQQPDGQQPDGQPADDGPLFEALLRALVSLGPSARDAVLANVPGPLATRAREALVIPAVLGTIDADTTPARRDTSRQAQLAQAFGLSPLDLSRDPDHPDGLDGYERHGQLGRGGMGEVLDVRDPVLNRRVALKVVHGQEAGAEAVARFIEEARLTAQLQHPGIVSVHSIGRMPGDRLYYTMQKVRGRTLTNHIKALHAPKAGETPPTLHRLVGWFHSACEAMAYAHSCAVIHRDLKPDNIMIGAFGEVVVMDWGIAKPLDAVVPDDDNPTLIDPDHIIERRSLKHGSPLETRNGDAVGTPMYMAPEQAQGDLDALGPTSDVFSLGSVLYQILTGRHPFDGEVPMAVMMQIILGRRRPVEGDLPIPRALIDICDRAMSQDPADRYPNAGAMAEEIAAWLEGARKRADALKLVREADGFLPLVTEHRAAARAHRQASQRALAELPIYAPTEQKRSAWAKADAADDADRLAAEAEVAREERLRAALSHEPDLPEAHARLARLYIERHATAEAARDGAEVIRYEALIRTHAEALPASAAQRADFISYLQGSGRLSVRCDPPHATARLYRYATVDRMLRPTLVQGPIPLPIDHLALPRGSYLVELEHPGRLPVRYPVLIDRGQHWDGRRRGEAAARPVVLPSPDRLTPHEVFVPAGPCWLGGDPGAIDGHPFVTRWVPAFVMQREPVTNGQYLEFINALVKGGREDDAIRWAPRTGSEDDEATYTWSTDLPVVMVDAECAEAYARWRAELTGLPWRLPTEAEWEKAARGVDGRFFPWGDHLDPSWCRMRDSAPADRPLVSVDAYPTDESPYGVVGLGGNVREWTSEPFQSRRYAVERSHAALAGADPFADAALPDEDRSSDLSDPADAPAARAVRGGSHNDAMAGCRAASRFRAAVDLRTSWLGFRLVRSLVDEDAPGLIAG